MAQHSPLYAGLTTSVKQEVHEDLKLDGVLPAGLCGTLYRMGPGLFERGGYKKPYLIDGDGMAQSFTFDSGKVEYRNRFVRTKNVCWLAAAITPYTAAMYSLLTPSWNKSPIEQTKIRLGRFHRSG